MANLKAKHKSSFTPKTIKTMMLGLAIAIVLTGFIILLINSFYPNPEWDDYCDERVRAPKLAVAETITQETCEEVGGKWTPQDIRCVTTPCPQGVCDYYSTCQKEYDTARDQYRLVAFIVSIIAGLAAISIGIMLALPSVSSGLMLGGTFLTFYGVVIYWTNLSKILKTLILGAVLVILIWLAYKKLEN